MVDPVRHWQAVVLMLRVASQSYRPQASCDTDKEFPESCARDGWGIGSAPEPSIPTERADLRGKGLIPMSLVWSCNEWDPLEEVIVGNALHARFPTSDPSTRLAEFPDRPLEDIPQGPFPQRIIEETEEDLEAFICRPDTTGHYGQTPRDMATRGQVLHHPLGIPGFL